ncbi:MAG: FAD-dependent oxidoreductase [Balneolaceae bacterium]
MKIGIIGAGIAGLAAGKELSLAGHEVTVIEKNQVLGGRLAARRFGPDNSWIADYGVSSLPATTPDFRSFAAELLERGLLNVWDRHSIQFDGDKLLDTPPSSDKGTHYIAPEGLDRVASYLSRWVDVKSNERAGGLTLIGKNRARKRPWMINLTSFNTFEADAVIVAAPAPEAYGVLLTTQDEVRVLKLIREIDEVDYDASFSLVVTYEGVEPPDWSRLACRGSIIESITNENSKRDLPETVLVVRSSPDFSRLWREKAEEEVAESLLEETVRILGKPFGNGSGSWVHFWTFARPRSIIERPFMELEDEEAPLAVIGDYFQGNDTEHSFCSGLKLARHWIEKYG